MRLLVVIPAYNEVESLPHVMADLQAQCPQYDHLVVNDGSTDGTAELCRRNGYNLLDLCVNLGLAGAFQAGLIYAYEHGYDAAIQFDADGQHAAACIAPMVQRMAEGHDIVIGSRFITVKKPKSLRMAGSFIISWSMRLATGHIICDPTSGMRLFNAAMIERFAQSLNHPPEPDTISYLLRCGAKVSEVQVQTSERIAGTSYFTFLKSVNYMVHTAISILLVNRFRKNDLREKESSHAKH